MPPAPGRIKLTILGGFLGAGKTTWLRHAIHGGDFADALVLVNEAAEVPVDGMVLSRFGRFRVIAGGCACCTGRGAFLDALREIADERGRTDTEISRIVVETSGLADPGAMAEAIRTDPMLVHHFAVDDVIVLVDGLHGRSQIAGEPLARRQIEAADRLVVTKSDVGEADGLATLGAWLAALNPGAERSASAMGTASVLPAPPLGSAGGFASTPETTPPLLVGTIDAGGERDWMAVTTWLSALLHARGDEIARVKGVLRTPAGRILIQSVRRVVQTPELLPDGFEPADGRLVVMGRGFAPSNLQRSLERFAGRECVAADPSERSNA